MADESGFDNVPWFVGGGAVHSPELLRAVAHLAAGGSEGVATPTDLRVSALPVATGRVRMSPGVVVVRNRSNAVGTESYVLRAPDWSYLDIPPTGSGSGRTDLIGVRVEDPQYDGFEGPPDAQSAQDWQYVRPFRLQVTAAQLADARAGKLDLGYPAYFLAYLEIPASTGTITNAMVKPLRQLVKPGFLIDSRMSGPTPEDALTGVQAEGGRAWPNYAPQIRVPAWATRAAVVATVSSVGQRAGAAQGLLTVVLGTLRAANITFDLDAPVAGGSRHTLIVGGDWSDVRAIAGQVVALRMEGRKTEPAGNPGYLVTVPGTQVLFDIRFFQDIVD